MSEDEKYMARCIQLARNGQCGAAPNPMVGAVIVCEGRIIGEGYHIRCGEAHAEVNAIRSVRDESLLARSTIYVSLEPCSHYGKTPPCADLIIAKRIPRVVVGCVDPFAQVSGRGIAKLREAGVQVTVGVLAFIISLLTPQHFISQWVFTCLTFIFPCLTFLKILSFLFCNRSFSAYLLAPMYLASINLPSNFQ